MDATKIRPKPARSNPVFPQSGGFSGVHREGAFRGGAPVPGTRQAFRFRTGTDHAPGRAYEGPRPSERSRHVSAMMPRYSRTKSRVLRRPTP